MMLEYGQFVEGYVSIHNSKLYFVSRSLLVLARRLGWQENSGFYRRSRIYGCEFKWACKCECECEWMRMIMGIWRLRMWMQAGRRVRKLNTMGLKVWRVLRLAVVSWLRRRKTWTLPESIWVELSTWLVVESWTMKSELLIKMNKRLMAGKHPTYLSKNGIW